MAETASSVNRYFRAIASSGLTIYDPIDVGHPHLWVPSQELEILLDIGLRGFSLHGLPLRTRSKILKERVCAVLGYPVPTRFRKTRPRFPGQMFDTYAQKSNNLQVWNEELASTRRYVVVRLCDEGIVERVRVVTGDTLSLLDTTGTLTQKYQARCVPGTTPAELISGVDTDLLRQFVVDEFNLANVASPSSQPTRGQLLSIESVFSRLRGLIGESFVDTGYDQERNRGGALHSMTCRALGYKSHHDDGQFPDIRHQLVEVKLQTSSTVDLGLVCPDSTEPLDTPQLSNQQIRHCDVRYAIFYAKKTGKHLTLSHMFVTTGADFFSRFTQCRGKVLNKKLQIRLPSNFFAR